MDSANSNSMQSSSGGDDQEYDSRAHDHSISAFLNSSSSSISTIPPPLFDAQSNYFTSFHHPTTNNNNNNPNSSLNFDMRWPSKTLTPPSHPTTTTTTTINSTIISPSMGPLPSHQNSPLHQTPARPSASSSSDQTRISKKRSRASRRAPTTVLTTDTSNFRAMVQEFTGIPAPPFSTRTGRFDLFNTSSRPPPPYLLRPFAQKLQPQAPPQPYRVASSGSNNNISSLVNSTGASNMNSSTTNNNYSLLSDQLGLPKQSHQNPTLTFQSLLQSNPPPKYSSPNSPIFSIKPQGSSMIDPNSAMGLLQDQFTINQGNATTTHQSEFPNLEEMVARNGDTSWDHGDHQGLHLRSFDENYDDSSRQVSSCKMMNSSTSGFNMEKAMENAPSRGGGGGGESMVDSWICSSD